MELVRFVFRALLIVLTLIFARGGDYAWLSLLAVAVFWIFAILAVYIGSKFEKPVQPGKT